MFSEFVPVNKQAWEEKIVRDLKGLTCDDLAKHNRNQILIRPFYAFEDIEQTGCDLLSQKSDWVIISKVVIDNEKDANKAALNELKNGAGGLAFVLNEGEELDLEVLLRDIEVQYIFLHFALSKNPDNFINHLKTFLSKRDLDFSQLHCCVSYDPIGTWVERDTGNIEEARDTYVAYTQQSQGLINLCIEGSVYQNAGANVCYELACVLAHANEYLNWLDETDKLMIKQLYVSVAVGTNFFEEIAKLRALKKLLHTLFLAYDINPTVHIHVETSDCYRSPYDVYNNLLRDATAAMAAAISGCDSIYIAPFDSAKDRSAFANRMSRNQQLIFKEESYLNRVADAAHGSYYVETLTNKIAENAWEILKDIEGEGGFLNAFKNGTIKSAIEKQAGQLLDDYRNGKKTLIGVNKYKVGRDAVVANTANQNREKMSDKKRILKRISLPIILSENA